MPDDPGVVLCFACIRNEQDRLPHFLAHHRGLGVGHFLFVANDCTDGSLAYLAQQPDCSVWTTQESYKAARFGMDWIGHLLARFGQGRWCLTLDADELLIYPNWPDLPLPALTERLEAAGRDSFGALMVELYPKGRLGASGHDPGGDPLASLQWLDAGPYRAVSQPHGQNPIYRGGVRDRVFYAHAPEASPTMNKVPLVKWHWRSAYRFSTHMILPPGLNPEFGPAQISGALLHTKFLPSIVARSAEEKARGQHFARSEAHHAYYDALIADPVLWSAEHSVLYEGWEQLVEMGLMTAEDGPVT